MAELTRFDPFRDLFALQDSVNRLFDDRASSARRETSLAKFAPAVDVFEDNEGLTLTVDVPGVDPKDVEVKVENGLLTVSGHRALEREEKKANYHRVERQYGTFFRSFSLPTSVEVDRIVAETKNGVLRVFLPRREETKPRKVEIRNS